MTPKKFPLLVTPVFIVFVVMRTTTAVNQCPNISVHWWESRPYVYDEDGTVSGVLPNIFEEAAKLCCVYPLKINWTTKIASYEKAWLDLKTNFSKESEGGSLDIWLPFSLLTPTSINMTALKIVESNQMILFVSEDKWDKMKSVYEGFKRIAPQVLATLLLTILFGILIWTVVGIHCIAITHVVKFDTPYGAAILYSLMTLLLTDPVTSCLSPNRP